MRYLVKKNKNNEFFTVQDVYTIIPGWKEPDYFGDIDSLFPSLKHDYAACIWPFVDGYARFIGKNGLWGYIDEKKVETHWLDEDVIYADDFSCGLARIQYVDRSYNYLDSDLKRLSDSNFDEATTFENDCAIVSDKVCKHYQIGSNGLISDKIALEYKKICEFEELKKKEKKKERTRKHTGVSDPESRIMDSLSGKSDSDEFGF